MRNLLLQEQDRLDGEHFKKADRSWRYKHGGIDLARVEEAERSRRVVFYASVVAKMESGGVGKDGRIGVQLIDGSRSWPGLADAARDVGVSYNSIGRSAGSNGRLRSRGYRFVFTDPVKRRQAERDEATRLARSYGKRKWGAPMAVVSDKGERWRSSSMAARQLGCCANTVLRAIRLNVPCMGRILSLAKDFA